MQPGFYSNREKNKCDECPRGFFAKVKEKIDAYHALPVFGSNPGSRSCAEVQGTKNVTVDSVT